MHLINLLLINFISFWSFWLIIILLSNFYLELIIINPYPNAIIDYYYKVLPIVRNFLQYFKKNINLVKKIIF